MSKIKVVDIKERMSFTTGGKREPVLDIQYETPKGYVGTLALPKAGFDKEKLAKAIKEDMAEQEAILGGTIEV